VDGIVPTNPILVFALVGVGLIRSTKTLSTDSTVKLWLIVVICACQFLFFAKYDEWWASSFSNRFLMTFIALSSVFTSSFIGYVGEKLFRAHAAAE
jgi:hypothetical protein